MQVLLSLYTVGGMVAGALFGAFYKVTKRFVFGISLLINAIGLALVTFGNNIVVIIIGMILAGFTFSIMMPGVYVIIGMAANPASFPICNSILLCSMNVFMFLATYWIGLVAKITNDAVVQPFFWGMIVLAALALIFIIVNPIPKPNSASTEK